MNRFSDIEKVIEVKRIWLFLKLGALISRSLSRELHIEVLKK